MTECCLYRDTHKGTFYTTFLLKGDTAYQERIFPDSNINSRHKTEKNIWNKKTRALLTGHRQFSSKSMLLNKASMYSLNRHFPMSFTEYSISGRTNIPRSHRENRSSFSRWVSFPDPPRLRLNLVLDITGRKILKSVAKLPLYPLGKNITWRKKCTQMSTSFY